MRPGITVLIPAIPPRGDGVTPLYDRAVRSVRAQTRAADALVSAFDLRHEGAAATRNRALESVRTQWVAFLDDDDVLKPGHLELLEQHAVETGADLVYPWFDVVNGFDPFPQYEGRPFDPVTLRTAQNYVPVTVLARTELVVDAGGFEPRSSSTAPGASPCEEWGLWLKMLSAGAEFSHLPLRTWEWHWHPGNTSGRGDRW